MKMKKGRPQQSRFGRPLKLRSNNKKDSLGDTLDPFCLGLQSLVRFFSHLYFLKWIITHGIFPTSSTQVQL